MLKKIYYFYRDGIGVDRFNMGHVTRGVTVPTNVFEITVLPFNFKKTLTISQWTELSFKNYIKTHTRTHKNTEICTTVMEKKLSVLQALLPLWYY